MWSKEYDSQVYENPPLVVVDPKSRELSRDECRELVPKMVGKGVYEEHAVGPVGRINSFRQDPATGSLWAKFQLRTDTPTYAKVCNKELPCVSLGHQVHFTVPKRTIEGLELSVCKRGERPNTIIVNASARGSQSSSAQASDFEAQAPHIHTTSMASGFLDMSNYDWVPETPSQAQGPVATSSTGIMPVKLQYGGKTYLATPKTVNASGAPQAAAQPQAPPPQQQQQQLAYPFNELQQQQQPVNEIGLSPPPAAAAAKQQQQPTQPTKVQEHDPVRNKAKKRAADGDASAFAGDEDADGDAMETDEKKAPAAPSVSKKAATILNQANTTTGPETETDLKMVKDEILGSNLSAAAKAALLKAANNDFEHRRQVETEAKQKVTQLVDAIEGAMRQKGQTDEDVKMWKENLVDVMDKPLKNPFGMKTLELMAKTLGVLPTGAGTGPAAVPAMRTGMNSMDTALEREIMRNMSLTQQHQQQPLLVQSSASTAPPQQQQQPSFPVRGSFQFPVLMEDGSYSVFQPQHINPHGLLTHRPGFNVVVDPNRGIGVNGRFQRPCE